MEKPTIDQLRIKEDGNTYLIHLDDFVDLQKSPAVFIDKDSWQGRIITEWWSASPLIHLPMVELLRIANNLVRQASTSEACDDS